MLFRSPLIIGRFSCLHILYAILILALSASCNSTSKHNIALYDAFFDKQIALNRTGSFDVALKSVDSLRNSISNPDGYMRYRYMKFHSSRNYFLGNIPMAANYVDSAIVIMEQYDLAAKFAQGYSELLSTRADYYYNANEFDKAFDYYSKSRVISKTLPENICVSSNQSYHLGMICYRQEKYEQAANYLKQSAYEISHCDTNFNNYYRWQEIYGNIALAYSKIGRNDSALLYYQKALLYIENNKASFSADARQRVMTEIAVGVLTGNLAKVYIATHKNDTAEQLLLKSLAINARPGYEAYDAAFTNMQLAELYDSEGRISDAKNVLTHLKMALDTLPNTSVNLRWLKLMYRYAKEAGQHAIANQYIERYLFQKDSLDEANKKLKKIDYGELLKDKETQYQIGLLTKDNQINRLWLLFSLGFAIVVIIILVLIYTNYRKSNKNVAILTDLNQQVSEQKNNLEHLNDELGKSNQDKDRILRIVAHDLRTPVSAVMMIGGILLDEETDEVKKDELSMIIQASQSMISLTEELLEFSGNNNQDKKGTKEKIDIRDVAKQVVGLLQFKADEKGQKINLTLPGEPIVILAYKEKINRVLSNLVTNAIKFSPEGAEMDVWVMKKHANALIQVKDRGIDIPEKMVDKVFDSFTTAKRYGTAGERSFGLGLSICKQIVDAHDGRIWVASTEGTGSSFFIELPLAP